MAFEFDMTQFERGLEAALPTTGRSAGDFLRTQARGLVRTLIQVTPPSSGSGNTGLAARRAGERTVEVDASRVVFPVRTSKIVRGRTSAVVQGLIEARRNRRDGRVRFRGRGDKVPVSTAVWREVLKQRKARVGILAAGWAPAARKLGVAVPAWVGRHGGRGYGGDVVVTPSRVSVAVHNVVGFNGTVSGFRRRVQFALDLQGERMGRAAASYWEARLRRAGFDLAVSA